ncbi:MAG: hypothetical protein KJ821_07525 [Actinobacteria bacterium]|nr:hypothetical protein [Actinomycetota bacterium]MBU4483749.1 hypothetical protein [Actinomycetota bacterium]MCG2790207.1 alkaline shock response membrane anchor protein AmaP [Actinomycetes bacterium]
MNIFNKVIVLLILTCIICVSLISIVNVFVEYFKWSDLALKVFNPEVNVYPFIAALALLMIFSISIFIILLEFYRRGTRVAIISSSKSGNAMVTLETVAAQIKNAVIKIDGLEEIKVKIVPKATGVIINMNAKLNEDMDIPGKMQEIINEAAGIVSDKLGIKVIKTNLTIVGLVAGRKEKEGKKKEEKEKAVEAVVEEAEDVYEIEDDDDSPG